MIDEKRSELWAIFQQMDILKDLDHERIYNALSSSERAVVILYELGETRATFAFGGILAGLYRTQPELFEVSRNPMCYLKTPIEELVRLIRGEDRMVVAGAAMEMGRRREGLRTIAYAHRVLEDSDYAYRHEDEIKVFIEDLRVALETRMYS